jgi:hypothetical protein
VVHLLYFLLNNKSKGSSIATEGPKFGDWTDGLKSGLSRQVAGMVDHINKAEPEAFGTFSFRDTAKSELRANR